MTKEEAGRVKNLLQRAGLPVRIPDYIDRSALVRMLYTDKKTRNGCLRFVIQRGIGEIAQFQPGVYAAEISEETAKEVIMAME